MSSPTDPIVQHETFGAVPARLCRMPETPTTAPAVLFFHGLGASSAAQHKELVALARTGVLAVGVDAPHHGARRGALLDRIERESGASMHEALLEIVSEAVWEAPMLVDALLARGASAVGAVGISMGAFIALGATAREPRIAATVALLGAPDWNPAGVEPTPRARELLADAPERHAERFAPRPLLVGNGGRDVNVPPASARRFVAALREHYRAVPERLASREYPESGHFMREDDWVSLWGETEEWFRRYLLAR